MKTRAGLLRQWRSVWFYSRWVFRCQKKRSSSVRSISTLTVQGQSPLKSFRPGSSLEKREHQNMLVTLSITSKKRRICLEISLLRSLLRFPKSRIKIYMLLNLKSAPKSPTKIKWMLRKPLVFPPISVLLLTLTNQSSLKEKKWALTKTISTHTYTSNLRSIRMLGMLIESCKSSNSLR